MGIRIYHGDSLQVLPKLEAESFDACITDPPYELGFMGKSWDQSGISFDPAFWKLVFNCLKPGAYLAAFGGSRTSHRIAVAIEDAGFEIRDMLMWLYGTGFPKSLDVSKVIDKKLGVRRKEVGQVRRWGANASGGRGNQRANSYQPSTAGAEKFDPLTFPASSQAQKYNGYGTALKPAYEPIILARKPLEGTVAQNVLKYGTGGLNIDGTRIGAERRVNLPAGNKAGGEVYNYSVYGAPEGGVPSSVEGRWPANVILDEGAAVMLDAQSGELTSGKLLSYHRRGGNAKLGTFNIRDRTGEPANFSGDSGGASRFFYTAKASRSEREAGLAVEDSSREEVTGRKPGSKGQQHARSGMTREGSIKNTHPTVKPLSLMRWLVKLVMPPDGILLEPFAGSGTTLVAAKLEGFNAVGVEKDRRSYEIACQSVKKATRKLDPREGVIKDRQEARVHDDMPFAFEEELMGDD